MKRHILLYGFLGGILIAALKLIEYRFLVVEHAFEIYGGLIALLFAFLGIWLGLTLTRKTPAPVVITEVRFEPAAASFVQDTDKLRTLGITKRELEKERAAGATEQVIEQKRQDMARYVEMYRNPLVNLAITLVEPLPVGLVMTVISSGLLGTRRRRVGATGQPEFG